MYTTIINIDYIIDCSKTPSQYFTRIFRSSSPIKKNIDISSKSNVLLIGQKSSAWSAIILSCLAFLMGLVLPNMLDKYCDGVWKHKTCVLCSILTLNPWLDWCATNDYSKINLNIMLMQFHCIMIDTIKMLQIIDQVRFFYTRFYGNDRKTSDSNIHVYLLHAEIACTHRFFADRWMTEAFEVAFTLLKCKHLFCSLILKVLIYWRFWYSAPYCTNKC